MRPNIRIEIQNDSTEAMDVDENEEGELEDSDEDGGPEPNLKTGVPKEQIKPNTTFSSVTEKADQEKLEERAKRFQLKPDEIKNFTKKDLENVHLSLGITAKNSALVRFESIHVRGIDEMTAEDLLDYFRRYAPESVEWINEESCNVVWLDQMSAARALHFISKPVRGMPVRDDRDYFETVPAETAQSHDSILLAANREVEIRFQDDSESTNVDLPNSIDIADITICIPPGYWRLGNAHAKIKNLLLRFSLKTDQQPFKIEPLSRYYRQPAANSKLSYNNKGDIQGIFGRNKDISYKNEENPWSVLAKNWDEDAKFRERERYNPENKMEIKNHSLRVRLGGKGKSKGKGGQESDSESEVPIKKTKIPRMRMYADEEEEKIKRKKLLTTIKKQFEKIENSDDATTTTPPAHPTDLRRILKAHSRKPVKMQQQQQQEEKEPDAVPDLGTTLRNRRKNMIFEVKTESSIIPVRGMRSDYIEQHGHHRGRGMERRTRRDLDRDESDYNDGKPKSKVAVVIKTHKKPSVASAVAASTVWSRISRDVDSDSNSSESNSEISITSETSSESDVDVDVAQVPKVSRQLERPGFGSQHSAKSLQKNPLKIEINNDHYRKN